MIDYEKERVEFEKIFPLPDYGCKWIGKTYCTTEYNAWRANEYCKLWEGWIARAQK